MRPLIGLTISNQQDEKKLYTPTSYTNAIIEAGGTPVLLNITRDDEMIAQYADLVDGVLYSGGDDVFLVGAWNDVIEAAQRIRTAFRRFTCGALSISAGIGLFHDHYPIRLAAAQAAELEDEAKEQPQKDSIALFAAGTGHVYAWDVFEQDVMGKKLACLDRFFRHPDTEQGTAFLYRLMELLRQAQTDRINLARYAYLLARMEPARTSPARPAYEDFSRNMYDWARSADDRARLITAIYIHVYLNRKEQ